MYCLIGIGTLILGMTVFGWSTPVLLSLALIFFSKGFFD